MAMIENACLAAAGQAALQRVQWPESRVVLVAHAALLLGCQGAQHVARELLDAQWLADARGAVGVAEEFTARFH